MLVIPLLCLLLFGIEANMDCSVDYPYPRYYQDGSGYWQVKCCSVPFPSPLPSIFCPQQYYNVGCEMMFPSLDPPGSGCNCGEMCSGTATIFTTCSGTCTCGGVCCSEGTPCNTTGPTTAPTKAPTKAPTAAPTTKAPTKAPTAAPTKVPTAAPTKAPTTAPTAAPSVAPTVAPTAVPLGTPTNAPTKAPTAAPSEAPTEEPTEEPSEAPTEEPTEEPSEAPVGEPTSAPTPSPQKGQNIVIVLGAIFGAVIVLTALSAFFIRASKGDTGGSRFSRIK